MFSKSRLPGGRALPFPRETSALGLWSWVSWHTGKGFSSLGVFGLRGLWAGAEETEKATWGLPAALGERERQQVCVVSWGRRLPLKTSERGFECVFFIFYCLHPPPLPNQLSLRLSLQQSSAAYLEKPPCARLMHAAVGCCPRFPSQGRRPVHQQANLDTEIQGALVSAGG